MAMKSDKNEILWQISTWLLMDAIVNYVVYTAVPVSNNRNRKCWSVSAVNYTLSDSVLVDTLSCDYEPLDVLI